MSIEKVDLIIPEFPFFVSISTIGKCNLKCKHCFYSCSPDIEVYLPRDKVIKLLDYLSKKGVKEIHFSGGEPLLDPNIFEYLKYAKDLNFSTFLITNGLLVTKVIADKLSKLDLDGIAISIDGSKPNHEFLRGQGTFSKTIDSLNILKEYDFESKLIFMVIHKRNINDIEYLSSLVDEYNFTKLQLLPLIPGGRARILKHLIFSAEEFRMFMLSLKSKKQKIRVSLTTPLKCLLNSGSEGPCPAGIITLVIDFNGHIYPCSALLVSLGNILTNNENILENIWKKNKLLNILRDIQNLEECKECPYILACRGGCRALSYLIKGDYCKRDPLCWI